MQLSPFFVSRWNTSIQMNELSHHLLFFKSSYGLWFQCISFESLEAFQKAGGNSRVGWVLGTLHVTAELSVWYIHTHSHEKGKIKFVLKSIHWFSPWFQFLCTWKLSFKYMVSWGRERCRPQTNSGIHFQWAINFCWWIVVMLM